MIPLYSLFIILSLLSTLSLQESPAKCKTQSFKQQVDHDPQSWDKSTFEQQYQVKADYYKPGGPIMFLQGDESPEFRCVDELVMEEWAKELGAYIVNIEHRFFGNSIPSNATDLIERYRTLTLENVLADSTSLVSYIKSTNAQLASAKVIIHGGPWMAVHNFMTPLTSEQDHTGLA
jgi:dipeptidyl-peptidase II